MSGIMSFHGKYLKLDFETEATKCNPDPPLRGKISKFSPAARKRLLRMIATFGDAVPIFMTLTYWKDWPEDPAEWKRHLDNFVKALKRHNPNLSGIWRLEAQKRGAPHFHLLVYGGRVPKKWVAETCARCSEDESAEHIKAGTRVESLRTAEGAMFYCAKYMAKSEVLKLPDYWENVGQHWGVFNRKMLPVDPVRSVLVSDLVASKMIGFMRERLQAYMVGKLAKERDVSEMELEGEKVIEDWVIPKSMLGDPVTFLEEFTRWIQGMMLMDVIKSCGDDKKGREIYEKVWRKRILREMDNIAKQFHAGGKTKRDVA